MKPELTVEVARDIYRYDGLNLWNKRRGNGIRYKLPVGCRTKLGYLVARYMGHQYKVHRIIG